MAAARRQQEYVPLSLEYTIVPGEPIYLVDVDGTLLKESQRVNDGLARFLARKPNVFLFTKMSHESVVIGVATIQEDLGAETTALLIRYNLINELIARGVTIQGVITPGDVRRTEKSVTGTVPGTHYVNYLGKLEYDSYVKSPSDKSSFLSPEEKREEKKYDANQEFKNEMYKMAKNYFSMVHAHTGPIVFIDDEPQQLFSVGMQELIEPLNDSIPLILIPVEPIPSQNQDFFTDAMRKTPRDDPSTILYNNIRNIIGEYFRSLNARALANKKGELLAFLNTMSPIPPEKRDFIERIRDLLNNWPAEPRAPAPIAAAAAARNGTASGSLGSQGVTTGQWACPVCTFLNPDSNIICGMCGTPRNGRPRDVVGLTAFKANQEKLAADARKRNENVKLEVGQWSCPKCTTINEKDDEKCKICYTIKPPPSDWDCSKCTYTNPGDLAACDMCTSQRTGGGKKSKSKNKTRAKKTLKSKKSIKKSKKTKKSNKSKKISKNRK
jgi:hypothetical protein